MFSKNLGLLTLLPLLNVSPADLLKIVYSLIFWDSSNQNKLTDPTSFYEKEAFETILKNIGLNVILIACQRNSLANSSGKHNSMSESTEDPLKMISSGYISALEFQKPNVEGILKNNLKEADINSSLVIQKHFHHYHLNLKDKVQRQMVDFHLIVKPPITIKM